MRTLIATILILILGAMLFMMVVEMPTFGDPENPSNNVVSQRYSEQVMEDVNVPNIITAIIADYRAYDTLGEATVLFTGIAAVLTVLGAHMSAGRKDDGNG